MSAKLPGVPNQPFRLLWREVLPRPTRSIRRALRHDFPVFDVWADASVGPQCHDIAHVGAPHFLYLVPFTECLPLPCGLPSRRRRADWRCASFGEAPEKVCPTIQPRLKIGSSAGSSGNKSLPFPVFGPVVVGVGSVSDLRLLKAVSPTGPRAPRVR